MQIISTTIGHFRALKNCSVAFADSTILVGQNGAGKSTVLQALRYFFDASASPTASDACYGSEDPVSVTVVLGELSADELEMYAEFLDDEQQLSVKKVGAVGEIPRYVARGKKYPGFDAVRSFSSEGAGAFLKAYRQFADEHPEYSLGKVRAAEEAKAELRGWEDAHKEKLIEADVELAFRGTTKNQLIPTTRIVYVPAVHRASDDFKIAKSPLRQMVDALVLSKLESDPSIEKMRTQWDDEYQKLFATAGATELENLSATLSNAIAEYVPGAAVTLGWQDAHPEVPMPEVWSMVSEDGIPTAIDQQGHGLQRAMIMALLQARDQQLRSEDEAVGVTHILLLIEEPELYQHPPRARHFRRLLKRLASEKSSVSRFRVVATTHSADFVSLDDIDSIRIVRKEPTRQGAPERRVNALTLEQLVDALNSGDASRHYSVADIRKNLHVLDAPLREAFFSSAIVLTEGHSDVGVLAAASEHLGFDLEAKDIVVTSTGGKGHLHIAIVMLSLLGIRKYVVFDADEPAQLSENQRILRLLGVARKDIPTSGSLPTAVRDSYAILHKEMEDVLKSEFGVQAYEECLNEAAATFSKPTDKVMKNPAAARFVVSLLYSRNLKSPTLDAIVRHLAAL